MSVSPRLCCSNPRRKKECAEADAAPAGGAEALLLSCEGMWVRTEPASGAHPSSSREPAVVDGASIANPSTLVLACLCLCSGGPRGRIVRPILEVKF